MSRTPSRIDGVTCGKYFKLTKDENELLELCLEQNKQTLRDFIMESVKRSLRGYTDNSYIGLQLDTTKILTNIYESKLEQIKNDELMLATIRDILNRNDVNTKEYQDWFINDGDSDEFYGRIYTELKAITDKNQMDSFIRRITKEYAINIGKLKIEQKARLLSTIFSTISYLNHELYDDEIKSMERIFGMTLKQAEIIIKKEVKAND